MVDTSPLRRVALRSQPFDGAVLLGCDESVPGLLMGGISRDLPLMVCPLSAGTASIMTAIADAQAPQGCDFDFLAGRGV